MLLPRGRFLVPEFTLCEQNAHEVEFFYSTWYKRTGWVTVRDHNDLAGQRATLRARNHVPPERSFCAHLAEELAILPTGVFIICSQDLWATTPLGEVGTETVRDAWLKRPLSCELCEGCSAWAF